MSVTVFGSVQIITHVRRQVARAAAIICMKYVKRGSKGSYAIIYKAASAIASQQSCWSGPPEFFL